MRHSFTLNQLRLHSHSILHSYSIREPRNCPPFPVPRCINHTLCAGRRSTHTQGLLVTLNHCDTLLFVLWLSTALLLLLCVNAMRCQRNRTRKPHLQLEPSTPRTMVGTDIIWSSQLASVASWRLSKRVMTMYDFRRPCQTRLSSWS